MLFSLLWIPLPLQKDLVALHEMNSNEIIRCTDEPYQWMLTKIAGISGFNQTAFVTDSFPDGKLRA